MNVGKLWKEFEQPVALFLGLVIAFTFCWLLFSRCSGAVDGTGDEHDAGVLIDARIDKPKVIPGPIPAPYDPKIWTVVESLSEVKGRWEGLATKTWAEIDARTDFEGRKRQYGSVYPWRLRFRPEQALERRSGWKGPIECGFYPRLQQAPKGPPTAAWRVSFCRGGDMTPEGGGRDAKRLLLLVSDKNPGRLSVQIGNEYFAELGRGQDGGHRDAQNKD